jgi:hypothetical protein
VPQQEELQGGGINGSLKIKLLSPPPFLFFVVKKMTTMPLLSSFVSFCYYEENDDNAIVVFFFLNITPLYLSWGNDGIKSINFPSCNSILAYNNKIYYCKIEIREL